MKTRSGKDVPYIPAAPKRSPVKKRALKPTETLQQITASATGEGLHTRWLRDRLPPSPKAQLSTPTGTPAMPDKRFITPEPFIPTSAPPIERPKFMRSPLHPQERIGFPGMFNFAETQDSPCFEEFKENSSPCESQEEWRTRVRLGLGPPAQGQPLADRGRDGLKVALNPRSQRPVFASPLTVRGGTAKPLVREDTFDYPGNRR